MNNNEEKYAKNLLHKGFLKAPKSCKCGNSFFEIQYDSCAKTSHCIFLCKNTSCRNRLAIRTNPFYNRFPKIALRMVSKIIKNVFKELNCTSCYNYIYIFL